MEKNIYENDTNAFRYCGEYYDKETATVYLRARNYNPSTGRFTQRDSYAGRRTDPLSLNLYTYCANNPVYFLIQVVIVMEHCQMEQKCQLIVLGMPKNLMN